MDPDHALNDMMDLEALLTEPPKEEPKFTQKEMELLLMLTAGEDLTMDQDELPALPVRQSSSNLLTLDLFETSSPWEVDSNSNAVAGPSNHAFASSNPPSEPYMPYETTNHDV